MASLDHVEGLPGLPAQGMPELLEQLEKIQIADLVLLDLRMPGIVGFGGLLKLRSSFPETPVAII